ncbi:MAG: hypothetical protein A7316_05710 [Candidatus Altiarchaeales archaeon WOR_SM1_86-2]|nr:MAG: hypothetical protein A7316_05710 [Candidatus Altiarchaeales archaeon WOR_SM1_86-2]
MEKLTIASSARLHMTLIDLNGSLGRVDGGIGLALKEPEIVLEFCKSGDLEISGVEGELFNRLSNAAYQLMDRLNIEGSVSINANNEIPEHSGLGSGTQSLLCTGYGISKLYDIDMSIRELACILGRGGTSGIGTAAFEKGGFIVDAGHRFGMGYKEKFAPTSASKGIPPAPVIANYNFPDWNVILAIPEVKKGSHGEEEAQLFEKLCPVPLREVREISHIILMNILPAIIEEDIKTFGGGVERMQRIGWKKIEIEYQHPVIAKTMETMKDSGAFGVGMSSWGPAVFGFSDSERESRQIQKETRRFLDDSVRGVTLITKARNKGVEL